jgi:hypothetical protein
VQGFAGYGSGGWSEVILRRVARIAVGKSNDGNGRTAHRPSGLDE